MQWALNNPEAAWNNLMSDCESSTGGEESGRVVDETHDFGHSSEAAVHGPWDMTTHGLDEFECELERYCHIKT